MVATARTPLLGPSQRWPVGPLGILGAPLPGLLTGSPDLGNPQRQATAMPIDPTDLAKSIGALGSLDPEQGLAPSRRATGVGSQRGRGPCVLMGRERLETCETTEGGIPR
jgi:hypothetical protein